MSFYRFEINAVPKPSANIRRLFFLASGFIKIFLIDFITFATQNM